MATEDSRAPSRDPGIGEGHTLHGPAGCGEHLVLTDPRKRLGWCRQLSSSPRLLDRIRRANSGSSAPPATRARGAAGAWLVEWTSSDSAAFARASTIALAGEGRAAGIARVRRRRGAADASCRRRLLDRIRRADSGSSAPPATRARRAAGAGLVEWTISTTNRASPRTPPSPFPKSSVPGARSASMRVAARLREREPGAFAGCRGSGRQLAHRRLSQSRQRRAAGVADHDAEPSRACRCAPLARTGFLGSSG